ncbi:MAG: hypothetical protein JRJ82_13675 [Deltaproteobacteria bacterium]|nr:hypothetical protein [Deltaproteobacteria bacterium]
MTEKNPTTRSRKKMAILCSYFSGESYGMLGPQMAATVIQENTPYDAIVVAVTREDDKGNLKKALSGYFGREQPVIGFSTLSGREDLFELAGELKDEGAFTLLAGPQTRPDYLGEEGWRDHPHRFPGLVEHFTCALQGPAEQAVPLLQGMETGQWTDAPGLLYPGEGNEINHNPQKEWEERYLNAVRWDNLYRLHQDTLVPLQITTGQVLQQIGCPHAAKDKMIEIDYPATLAGEHPDKVKVRLRGCSFCDVAMDKGFFGALDMATVLAQMLCLPEGEDSRKIPFELINENPLPGLPRLLKETREKRIPLSQINLILRADWFLKGEKHLRESLILARDMDVRILLASVGFESFDDRILHNLHKGLDTATNLEAIRLMRRIKEAFPQEFEYARTRGAVHGLIHPTPWDNEDTSLRIKKVINIYGLPNDILPDHSIPLIIHHASGLGDWIREIEKREKVLFKRYGSTIGWRRMERG